MGAQEATTRQTLVLDDNRTAVLLYGAREDNLRILESELGIGARARGNEVRLSGAETEVVLARRVLEELYGVVRGGKEVGAREVRDALKLAAKRPASLLIGCTRTC